ncbi:cell division protein FtsI/penicillin-binding protein 2 [Fontibacillus phaseoli]|uniref:Cell division protein FtsI/penicillin-binding protein 2 n=1 Tax=Fontibacillus phaseoli TaxID=1416533 RepID=A0A369BLL0_9BACL|nr:penicillin-binding transpeptidase domain-containing protein [Fontibacillus phaseoli]RCX22482.1 cell division protein FtsI/penicillin-binding protein 2 [Fontibacillus phaseoli]
MSLLHKKRIFYILIAFIIVIAVFVARIAWIQWASAYLPLTASGKTMNEMAVRQREEGIMLDSGRGHFVDRNGMSLTGFTTWRPTLFPVSELPDESQIKGLANRLGISPAELKLLWSGLLRPQKWRQPKEKALPAASPVLGYGELNTQDNALYWDHRGGAWPPVNGFEVLPFMERYPAGMRGNQWLGYVAQRPEVIRKIGKTYPFPLTMQVGASGLERTMDRFLRGSGGTRVYYSVDGKKRPFPQIGTRVEGQSNPYYPVQIATTVDNGIQQQLEKIVDRLNVQEGAVVVLDARQGDVISMVSRPFYDPVHVDLSSGDWSNRAVKAVAPGSVFKTVIAAAALEGHVTFPGEVFHCSGHYGKYGLSCWKEGGHGDITLKEGFANSCNVVFATLGERLSADVIERTAYSLGLNRKIGWSQRAFMGGEDLSQIDQEEKGAVFSPDVNMDGGVLAQTSLGQRDVLVTPLQAANLVVTLLHDGEVAFPRLVTQIRFRDGSVMANFPVHTTGRTRQRISAHTAGLLLDWMRQVVEDGTGSALKQAKWPLAGKSGTAQIKKGGKKLNHQWFIGYGPVGNPKYAVAVLVQNRPEGSPNQATALFRQTLDMLAEQGS